jgi:cytochrome c oxidase cbb3-type subunit 3
MHRWWQLHFVFVFALAVNLPLQVNSTENESVRRGQALFQQSCAICHGTEATGGGGPNLIQSSLVRHDKNGNLIMPVIQEGRVDKGMPAFPLMTSANISGIVAFLHARIEVASVSSSNGLADGYSLKQLLTGNAAAGRQYFNGKGGCSACHSPTGDLAGISDKYSPVELEARFLYPPDDNVTATVSLSSGEKVQGKLLHLDAFYVAIQNEDGWYRSWPLREAKVQVHDPLAGHLELLDKYKDKDIHDVFAYMETFK